uniref:Uncharacterized protein n=1 Tax=Rhipicephalus pulchellus TaxID=72859 RepID=L7M053_RHIPC
MRLVHAFALCHFSYVAGMLIWTQTELNKLNRLIKRLVKTTVGLPVSTPDDELMKLGLHNTIHEIIEAQQIAHRERLSGTRSGRAILEEVGWYTTQSRDSGEDTVELNDSLRDKIRTTPFPRNMHPVHNQERRKARAKALLQEIEQDRQHAAFVDAAWVRGKKAFTAVVVDADGLTRDALTIMTQDATVAEQVAIALALRNNKWTRIYSDSKMAIRHFTKGFVTKRAAQLIGEMDSQDIEIRWFPAHMGSVDPSRTNLNEVANAAARGLTIRALRDQDPNNMQEENRDRLLTYNEVTKHYYMNRREFPVPHAKLNRSQAVTLRLLQTRTYPNPNFINKIYPDREVQINCEKCNDIITLDHMLWQCPVAFTDCDKERDWWQRVLHSGAFSDQAQAVQKAHDTAVRLNLTVPTWEPPAST